MEEHKKEYKIGSKWILVLKVLLVTAAVLILGGFLWYAPDGLLGKMDAVGYAVCHRIEVRSFHIGERAVPLCARCSGMQLGALLAFLYQLQWGRRGKLPPVKVFAVLAVFLAAFGIDGLNSYMHFFPNAPHVYEPNNYFRLITGTGLGLGIGLVIYPVFNQTMWKNWIDEHTVGTWKSFLGLLGLAVLLDLAIISENLLLLYPLAILSGLTVILLLGICYTMVLILLFKKDNEFSTLRSAWVPLLSGFSIALLQILLVDILRYSFTGTWGGFSL